MRGLEVITLQIAVVSNLPIGPVDNAVQEEDYNVGLKLQQGLETGLMKSVLFGRNERGNQYFHRWVKWYSDGNTSAPKPEL